MNETLSEYLPILIFIDCNRFGGGCARGIFYNCSAASDQKNFAYECGFDVFDDARQFDVRFYLVAILFIIFDLEIAFFPLGNFFI